MLAVDSSSWLGRLPTELIDIVSGGNDGTMSRAEAKAYRLELMNERTVLVEASDSNYFGREFNTWYVLGFFIVCPTVGDGSSSTPYYVRDIQGTPGRSESFPSLWRFSSCSSICFKVALLDNLSLWWKDSRHCP